MLFCGNKYVIFHLWLHNFAFLNYLKCLAVWLNNKKPTYTVPIKPIYSWYCMADSTSFVSSSLITNVKHVIHYTLKLLEVCHSKHTPMCVCFTICFSTPVVFAVVIGWFIAVACCPGYTSIHRKESKIWNMTRINLFLAVISLVLSKKSALMLAQNTMHTYRPSTSEANLTDV